VESKDIKEKEETNMTPGYRGRMELKITLREWKMSLREIKNPQRKVSTTTVLIISSEGPEENPGWKLATKDTNVR
jgi:hypothetical protein